MADYQILFATLIGITCSYVFETREKGRLRLVLKYPRANWPMFVFDYLACGFIGLAAASYLFEAKTVKEGFLLGLTWEASIMAALNTHTKTKSRR